MIFVYCGETRNSLVIRCTRQPILKVTNTSITNHIIEKLKYLYIAATMIQS